LEFRDEDGDPRGDGNGGLADSLRDKYAAVRAQSEWRCRAKTRRSQMVRRTAAAASLIYA